MATLNVSSISRNPDSCGISTRLRLLFTAVGWEIARGWQHVVAPYQHPVVGCRLDPASRASPTDSRCLESAEPLRSAPSPLGRGPLTGCMRQPRLRRSSRRIQLRVAPLPLETDCFPGPFQTRVAPLPADSSPNKASPAPDTDHSLPATSPPIQARSAAPLDTDARLLKD